jgi:mRNA interferase MazF
VWLDFMPNAGHEQGGRRPAVVLSTVTYSSRSRLALVCPITNQVKGYPFEHPIPPGCGTTGVVLTDQVKSFDWRARHFASKGALPAATLQDVLLRARSLLA